MAVSLQNEPAARQARRDQDILTARRIDWRFLLPNPELKQVLLVGAAESALAAALERFCEALTVVEPQRLNQEAASLPQPFDLVVVGAPDKTLIPRVLPLLKTGGTLYWEVQRNRKTLLRGNRKGYRNARRYAAYLQGLQLKEVDLHWHRPNFGGCLEIIPLNRSRALTHSLAKTHSSLKGKLKIAAGKTLRYSGLLPYTVSCFSLVGQK